MPSLVAECQKETENCWAGWAVWIGRTISLNPYKKNLSFFPFNPVTKIFCDLIHARIKTDGPTESFVYQIIITFDQRFICYRFKIQLGTLSVLPPNNLRWRFATWKTQINVTVFLYHVFNSWSQIRGEKFEEREKSLLKESPPPRSRTAHKNGSYSASAPEKRILLFAEKINFFSMILNAIKNVF